MPHCRQPSTMYACQGCIMRNLSFGVKLKMLREAQDLTVSEASAKCGVPEKTWERIEAGNNAPSSANFVRILKGLHVSINVINPQDLEEQTL